MLLLTYFVHIFERQTAELTPLWSSSNAYYNESQVYQDLNLQPVYGNKSVPVIFRLWMYPSWGRKTVITLYISNRTSKIDVLQFVHNYSDNTETREIVKGFSVILDENETQSLVDKIMDSKFLIDEPAAEKNHGLDGWTWHIEANIHGKYLYDEAWAQTEGALFEIGMTFIEASGLIFKCFSGACRDPEPEPTHKKWTPPIRQPKGND